MEEIDNVTDLKTRLWGSFLLFCQMFYPRVTGRDFIVSKPTSRESHIITISRELTKCARLQTKNLVITVPPGYGKSTLVSMWVAWTLSRYPDSQYLYIAYGHELAAKHTAFIKRIVSLQEYAVLFDVKIRHDSRAKDFFQTEEGGTIKALASGGAVVGQDAGLPGLERFSGAVVIDDPIKPDEVYSDSIRENVIRNYRETIAQRPRSPNVPIICIAQRLHEADLPAFLMSGLDERVYDTLILKSLDDAGNALYPEVHSKEQLEIKKSKSPYVFAAQFQQDPLPAGGALYKREDFAILDDEPELLMTFITADSAETDKNYNDATVFSFWGLYFLDDKETMALHWIDCMEIFVEPKDLKEEFMSFYGDCMRHKHPPRFAAIEKKSTGVTLISALKEMRGMSVREVLRTRVSGSKTTRFLEMQACISSRLISFTDRSAHMNKCIEHMMKITANDSHRRDDIADTCYDACKIALIDKTLYVQDKKDNSNVTSAIMRNHNAKKDILNRAYYASRNK